MSLLISLGFLAVPVISERDLQFVRHPSVADFAFEVFIFIDLRCHDLTLAVAELEEREHHHLLAALYDDKR